MHKSLGLTNPKGAMKVKACLDCRPRCDPAPLRVGPTPARLVLALAGEAELIFSTNTDRESVAYRSFWLYEF